jgi:hypothetical protein
MAEIINLRRARKTRARAQADADAAANRAKFGQTSAAREIHSLDTARAARTLAGARREPCETPEPE